MKLSLNAEELTKALNVEGELIVSDRLYPIRKNSKRKQMGFT